MTSIWKIIDRKISENMDQSGFEFSDTVVSPEAAPLRTVRSTELSYWPMNVTYSVSFK